MGADAHGGRWHGVLDRVLKRTRRGKRHGEGKADCGTGSVNHWFESSIENRLGLLTCVAPARTPKDLKD
eukprot:6117866-Alexandrium_andersonii.AAC.1